MAAGWIPLDTDVTWIHGSASRRRRNDPHRSDPPQQVHHLAPGTVLIRQSKDVTYEAPFILLLLGERRSLLVDTGAVEGSLLRETVDRLIAQWLADRAQSHDSGHHELVVAHSHAHGDHVAGDAAFADRPHTTVVGPEVADVQAYFGIDDWPRQVVPVDLGGRVVDVFGIPGHEAASIALHDRSTGLLHTGDTVYPGRIYVGDSGALLDSLDRLAALVETGAVSHVLGCHVEMTNRPGRDYALGARFQPDEPSPFMTPQQLLQARDDFRTVAGRPGIHRFDDIVFCVGEGPRVTVPLYAQALVERLRHLVR
ncbi:MBL fold metallo-hydrolase [Humibacillus xanthopallidus]|uniref:Glyoxylase-like metal-dependent hydrolase (Beta-lactamase superfamily II) n=1 Tax=Humibacillus xanthopallidus TaxID=412689 RepID=A0A543I2B4_9MICO|nr:MBL fold metallo-hydrolase [Humibacillus xanthopallidus]TQM64620.1 glyoxylase-like metal-dependent hydrolase (beta-lactamase superfamily II) [Humibacillus xanthopallidus]